MGTLTPETPLESDRIGGDSGHCCPLYAIIFGGIVVIAIFCIWSAVRKYSPAPAQYDVYVEGKLVAEDAKRFQVLRWEPPTFVEPDGDEIIVTGDHRVVKR